ncbi:MAG: DUF1214 domain-containing protein [Sandaracinaceae bacterium]|nr:DUF1214 domain-containing protein [Myxococcales bacterium]MCB9660489.1 DUF1214 domain-containing protein [Sandaracinaceae bacterium]
MRKMLFRLMGGYRRASLFALKLRGHDERSLAEERVVTGKVWDDFCDDLRAAGATLAFPGAPNDVENLTEGYRYLTRLMRAGLENFLEFNDPAAPVLRRMVHETVKMGADNPDNYYQNCAISGAMTYRIRGTRGTVAQLNFGTQKGNYGEGEGGMPPTGRLDALNMEIAADGTFEILVSCERPASGNWLPMEPETNLLIVRQTFLDRETEQIADLTVERIDGDSAPTPLTAQRLDEALEQTTTLVAGASVLFAKWARDFQQHTNELPMFDQEVSNKAGGDPNIRYYHSHWRLAPDEALVIEVTPPECQFWNFQLNNYWMESLDYRYFRVHTNKHLAKYEPDGSVRVVVAHQDPGLPNWIQTVGHDQGTMCWRWIHAESAPQPRTRVVKLRDLRA